jgi:Mn-dependent DtxR family transcriptional regulator
VRGFTLPGSFLSAEKHTSLMSPFFAKLIRRFLTKAQKRRINLTKKGSWLAKSCVQKNEFCWLMLKQLPFSL